MLFVHAKSFHKKNKQKIYAKIKSWELSGINIISKFDDRNCKFANYQE